MDEDQSKKRKVDDDKKEENEWFEMLSTDKPTDGRKLIPFKLEWVPDREKYTKLGYQIIEETFNNGHVWLKASPYGTFKITSPKEVTHVMSSLFSQLAGSTNLTKPRVPAYKTPIEQ